MAEKSKNGVESSRREFLKRAGKLAVYTPPAMLALSSPSFAHIAQSGGCNPTGETRDYSHRFFQVQNHLFLKPKRLWD
jgi:hypothetical protein